LIGYGAVCKTVINYMWHRILSKRKIQKLIIIEPLSLSPKPKYNYTHIKVALTKSNYKKILDEILVRLKIDLVIDLSVHVSGIAMSKYFQKRKVHYLNTSIEEWRSDKLWDGSIKNIKSRSLKHNQTIVKRNDKGVTHMIDCGMNPGLVSIFVKYALEKLKTVYKISSTNYTTISKKLDLETIHIAEIDTQKIKIRRKKNEFLNTWSCVGFWTEAIDPVQIGFGTQDRYSDPKVGDGNQIIIPIRGMDFYCRSFEPMNGEFTGMLIPHSENNTISEFLDKTVSVYYVYKPSIMAEQSLNELRRRKYTLQERTKVVTNNDIVSGFDSVGVLFLFKDKPCFWCGSILTYKAACTVGKDTNATLIQVACGILIAIEWMLNNRKEGVCWAESIPTSYLKLVKRYLGTIFSDFVNKRFKSTGLESLTVKK
jgi:homospermidine synthase